MPNRLIQNVFHWILLKDISGCPQTSGEWKISKSYQLLLHQLQAHQTLLYWVLPSKRSLSSFLASLLSFLNCLSISALILFCSFCSSLKQQAIFIYLLSKLSPSLTRVASYHCFLFIRTWALFSVELSEKLVLCFLYLCEGRVWTVMVL